MITVKQPPRAWTWAWRWPTAVTLWCAFVAGCDPPKQSVQQFVDQFAQAMVQGQGEELYDLLDSRSQRLISRDVQVLRGLDPATQWQVLRQLGATTTDPDDKPLSANRYFALLWQQAVGQQAVQLQVQNVQEDTAEMILMVEAKKSFVAPARTVTLDLVREAGRWRWRLPPQRTRSQHGLTSRPD